MKINALRASLTSHLIRSGIRTMEHPTAPDSSKRIRKSITLANGFRKHVISTFIEAGLNHEIRELLVDHATQLDQHYFRPTQDQVLQEYLKPENMLTIDPSLRYQKRIETLEANENNYLALRKELDELRDMFNNRG